MKSVHWGQCQATFGECFDFFQYIRQTLSIMHVVVHYIDILVQGHSQNEEPSIQQEWNDKTEIYSVIVSMVVEF